MPPALLAMVSTMLVTRLPTDSWPAILLDHHIQWKELYPIAHSCVLWGHLCLGRRFSSTLTTSLWWIYGPSSASQYPHITQLVCSIFVSGAIHHFTILVFYIVGTGNSIADSLSRLQMARFCQLAPVADSILTSIPPSG